MYLCYRQQNTYISITCLTMWLKILLCILTAVVVTLANNVAVVPNESVKDGTPSDFISSPETERFVPTNEWQTVKTGQHIPAGLHVRLNLATGEREAKLLQEESQKDNDRLSLPEVEKALKDLRTSHSDDPAPDVKSDTPSPTTADPRTKFRSYEELREEYAKMGMAVKSDSEIMRELLVTYRNENNGLEKRVAALEDLEYLVHQLDNGVDFVNMGGLSVMAKSLNMSLNDATSPDSSATMIQSRIAHLIGSAAQSNPPVQIAIVDTEVLSLLMRNLAACVHHPTVDDVLKNKLVYAITSTIRSFPYAQLKFINSHGLELINSVLSDNAQVGTESSSQPVDRIKMRFVTLLYDLLQEAQLSKEHDENEERQKQYASLEWARLVRDYNWCKLITQQYISLIEHADTDFASLNFADKVLDLLTIMWQIDESECSRYSSHLSSVNRIIAKFNTSAEQSTDDDHKEFISDITSKLKHIFEISSSGSTRTEL